MNVRDFAFAQSSVNGRATNARFASWFIDYINSAALFLFAALSKMALIQSRAQDDDRLE
jgi:hypothetical protein